MAAISSAAEPRNADFFARGLAASDPEVFKAIGEELKRQQDKIELIASENIVSQGGAGGAGLGPHQQIRRRLSGPALLWRLRVCRRGRRTGDRPGQALVQLRLRQCPAPFRRQANQAVFFALLQPGDTFMGLDLAAGGHLTHGSPVNMSGKWFKPVSYRRAPAGPAHRHG